MAQNFWIAIDAWVVCFLVTMLVSLVTKPKTDAELRNLVYGVTDVPKEEGLLWFQRPTSLALMVIVVLVGLNLLFW
jgi:SSS family solute:Na+ symporter